MKIHLRKYKKEGNEISKYSSSYNFDFIKKRERERIFFNRKNNIKTSVNTKNTNDDTKDNIN